MSDGVIALIPAFNETARVSNIQPWQDTVRFFKLAKKYWP